MSPPRTAEFHFSFNSWQLVWFIWRQWVYSNFYFYPIRIVILCFHTHTRLQNSRSCLCRNMLCSISQVCFCSQMHCCVYKCPPLQFEHFFLSLRHLLCSCKSSLGFLLFAVGFLWNNPVKKFLPVQRQIRLLPFKCVLVLLHRAPSKMLVGNWDEIKYQHKSPKPVN